jgi:hypothetical protein
MRALLALAFACLLVTAGCSALVSSGDPTGPAPTSTDTLTPVPYTPTATPTPYPPGLEANGEITGLELATAHVEALQNTSFTVVEVRALHYENGSVVQNITERARIGTDRRRYRFTLAATRRFSGNGTRTQEVVAASNGTLVVEKRDWDGGHPSYSLALDPAGTRIDPLDLYHGSPRNRDRLIRLYEVGEFSVTRTAEGFRLRSSEPLRVDGGLFGAPLAHPTVTSITVSLTPAGRVRWYRMAFEAEFWGEPVTGVERVRYSSVGNTTVPEPAWFEETVAGWEAQRGENTTESSRALAAR